MAILVVTFFNSEDICPAKNLNGGKSKYSFVCICVYFCLKTQREKTLMWNFILITSDFSFPSPNTQLIHQNLTTGWKHSEQNDGPLAQADPPIKIATISLSSCPISWPLFSLPSHYNVKEAWTNKALWVP